MLMSRPDYNQDRMRRDGPTVLRDARGGLCRLYHPWWAFRNSIELLVTQAGPSRFC